MRIKLEEAKHYCFSTELNIRISDINYGQHLSNDKVLTFAHQARIELFESWGFSELNFGGAGIIMTDAALVFQSEGFLNDLLKIEIAVVEISRVGFELLYQLSKKESAQKVAILKTGFVCFDYELKKVVAIPALALDKLQSNLAI